jgi:PAP2 superfamily
MRYANAWALPSIALTGIAATIALLLVPNPAGLMAALLVLPAWMAVALLIACLYGFGHAALTADPAPLQSLKRFIAARHRDIVMTGLIMLVAGLNMISFMWIKTLLNYKVAFWADPLLAQADHALFAGHDPWALLQFLNFPGAGIIYHPVWFIMLILALLSAAAAKPGPTRSAMLLSYFVLWTVVGPAIHILLPAAGPIFYERMGYGARFGAIASSPEVKQVADYLWETFASQRFGAGSGISAMPSMHVTMSTWTVIAFHQFVRRWLALAVASWVVIFAMSIALGWHYASDGIVGALAAWATYAAIAAMIKRGAALREYDPRRPATQPT